MQFLKASKKYYSSSESNYSFSGSSSGFTTSPLFKSGSAPASNSVDTANKDCDLAAENKGV